MKVKFLTILILLAIVSCSNTNQNQNVNSSSSTNISVENRLANKDFTNKPVNLNNPKDRAKFDKQISELTKNRELWKSQNISNYGYTMQQFSEGMGNDWKLVFKVRDNKPIPFENMTYPEFHKYENSDTIDELFDYIKDSMEEGWSVNVKFENSLGYPKEISVGGMDGFMSKKIEKFEIVK